MRVTVPTLELMMSGPCRADDHEVCQKAWDAVGKGHIRDSAVIRVCTCTCHDLLGEIDDHSWTAGTAG